MGELPLLFVSYTVVWTSVRERPSYPLAPHHLQQAGSLAPWSQEQERCPCPSLGATLGREGPAPYLGSTAQLTLTAGVQASQP